jgi:hypothetical protein
MWGAAGGKRLRLPVLDMSLSLPVPQGSGYSSTHTVR